MKNLTRKAWMMLMTLAILLAMAPAAAASEAGSGEETSFWEDVKATGSNLYQSAKENAPGWWQSVKDAASGAVDTVREHGPEWVEAAGEKGSELLEQGKDALQSAGDKVSGFLEDQQDQFWERTEQQIYGNSSPDVTSDGGSSSDDVVGSGSATGSETASSGTTSEASGAPDGAQSGADDTVTASENQNGTLEAGSETVDQPVDKVVPTEDEAGSTDADVAQPAGEAQDANMDLVWMAISLGLVAISCGCLYALRDKSRH